MISKKLKTIVGSAVAGGVLLALSATAFASSSSGYESYKTAVKSIVTTENATIDAQYEVKDNGTVIFSGDTIQKLDNENRSSKTSTTIDGTSKTYESSNANGTFIIDNDGNYYQMNKAGKDEKEKLSESSSSVKLAELVTDTLVGDVKNQFIQDGDKINVNLEGEQIPELAKLAVSAAVENSNREKAHNNSDKIGRDGDLKAVMDKVSGLSNIDVKSISMTATVDGDTLKDNNVTGVITGTDTNGTSHELTLTLDAKISDVGNTKADTIDVTGKQVTTIAGKEQHSNQ
ncbi:hypothetical protein [Clostridium sp. BL-8]|uniref:hypothetical protein n=1 Tax=Clostridium sp. BL-8 TaxID=349938 RepID=UPI00098CB4FC|nr:hypothetical protein [Clostridium sp. BL-8]OOM75232.1 hypothetical protein CLOBL_40890 [Clostridium sp. BL-8]